MPSHEEKVKDKHGQSESVVILVPLKRPKRAVLEVRWCVSWNAYFTKRTRNHIYLIHEIYFFYLTTGQFGVKVPLIQGRQVHPSDGPHVRPWCRQGSAVEFTNVLLFFLVDLPNYLVGELRRGSRVW
jgi:hypothetical protein